MTPGPDHDAILAMLRAAVVELEYDLPRMLAKARDEVFTDLIANLKARHEANPDLRLRLEQVMAILKDQHDKDRRSR